MSPPALLFVFRWRLHSRSQCVHGRIEYLEIGQGKHKTKTEH